jgi:hypothetical protein
MVFMHAIMDATVPWIACNASTHAHECKCIFFLLPACCLDFKHWSHDQLFNLWDSRSIRILSSELLEISNIVLLSLNGVLAVPELGT